MNSFELRLDCAQHCVSLLLAGNETDLSVSVSGHGATDDPEAWLKASEALAELSDFDRLVATDAHLVIRATEIGMVSLDGLGNWVYPLLWASDERSRDDAMWCRKKFDDAWWMEEVGLVPEALHLVTKLSWLHRSETETWDRIRFICSLEDFVSGRLVADQGSATIMTRPELAAEFGVWSPRATAYSDSVLALIDGHRDWVGVLPTVCPAGTELGRWRQRTIGR